MTQLAVMVESKKMVPVVAGSIPRGDTLESTGNPESTDVDSIGIAIISQI
jgi:hypothetical protein